MKNNNSQSITWKDVPGFSGYEISENGDLRHGEKQMTPDFVQGSGRKRFSLSKAGRNYRITAHRLVALAFIGPKPFEGAEVCHNDGVFLNNHFSNLRWDTHAENVADAMRHKLQRKQRFRAATKRDLIALACSEFLASVARPS